MTARRIGVTAALFEHLTAPIHTPHQEFRMTRPRSAMVLSLAASLALSAALTTGCSSGPRRVDTQGMDRQLVLVNRDRTGLAIEGYDPVAYFTDSRPVMGLPAFTSTYMGATYRFASADHKAMFVAAPEAYAPAYGGYCGYAASVNRLSPVNPEFWQIQDGRLILQHNQRAYDLFNQSLADNVARADSNWPGLVGRNGQPVKILVFSDDSGVALGGFDLISYYTQPAPVPGSGEHAAVYNAATYWFASEDNRRTFESDPARYIPAFGGYCGYAASINKVSPTDPLIYQIIDNRLVLQHTDEAYRLFNQNAAGNLAKADRNWPGLVERWGR